jgi:hypothetical protein
MPSEEPQNDLAGAPVPNQPAKGDRMAEETTTPPGTGHRLPLWLLTLAAGLVIGALSWVEGQLTQDALTVTVETPPEVARMPSGPDRSAKIAELLRLGWRATERNKSVAAYGLLGALLGVTLGLIGGWTRGAPHWRSSMVSGLTAAIAGAGLAWVLTPVMYQLQDAAQISDPDFSSKFLLIHSIYHAIISVGIGSAAGLALGWGLGDRSSLGRSLMGGFFGGVGGVLLFETINSLAFPMMHAETPLPEESLARLAMYLGVAGGVTLLAGLAADARPRRSTSASLAG